MPYAPQPRAQLDPQFVEAVRSSGLTRRALAPQVDLHHSRLTNILNDGEVVLSRVNVGRMKALARRVGYDPDAVILRVEEPS